MAWASAAASQLCRAARAAGRPARLVRGRERGGEGVEVVHEDVPGELAVADGRREPGELARVVAPGLVAGEQQPVVAEAAPLDLGCQPAGREADGPAGVGVDPLARGDPVEEPAADQLDVPADPAAQVDQVDADVVGVTVDEEPDEVDAEAPSGEVCTWTTRSCVAAAAKISSSSGAHLGGVGAPAKQARPAPLAAAPPTMKQEVVSVRCWTSIVTEWMH